MDLYNEVFKSNKNLFTTELECHINKMKEMDRLLHPSNSFLILTNTTLNNFPFVSKNFHHNLGLDIEKMTSIGVPYWLSHFHPEELSIWIQILRELMNFTMEEVPVHDRKKVSYTWNNRVKNASGHYLNLFVHQVPIILDEQGKPIIGLSHHTVIGENEPLPMKSSVKILNDQNEYETLWFQNHTQKLLTCHLTNRENDIIRLLALDLTSKEIGKRLSISPHTVDTHRRKILQKLELKSTGELIAYMKAQQLF